MRGVARQTQQVQARMGHPEESFELRRQRLGIVVRELAQDLVEARRRTLVLEREVRELRARLAAYEAREPAFRSDATHSGRS